MIDCQTITRPGGQSGPLRLFVYEYLSATGLGASPVAESLRTEGLAILSAVLEDFTRIPGVDVLTLLHEEYRGAGRRWPHRTRQLTQPVRRVVPYFFRGCNSNLRTYSSNPSHCSRTLPAAGLTS
jgi:hypothetical protein